MALVLAPADSAARPDAHNGAQPGLPPPPARALAERCALLGALLALRAAAGAGCGPGRWVELAGALRGGVLAGAGAGRGAPRQRAELLARAPLHGAPWPAGGGGLARGRVGAGCGAEP
jgi:hypothetical protein